MEDTSAEASPYHSDASEHYDSLSETSAHHQKHCRRRTDNKPFSKQATKEEPSMTPPKYTMCLQTCHLLSTVTGQPHSRKLLSLSPPQMTLEHNTYFKFQLRSASMPNLTLRANTNQAPLKVRKGRKSLPTQSTMKKRHGCLVTGDPDDLEDWEWDDPVVRRLADAVFAIREERKLTVQRLEAIDEKIDALRRNLVGKDAA